MFERFAALYGVPAAPAAAGSPPPSRWRLGGTRSSRPAGWEAFQQAYGGKTFGGGVYRTLRDQDVERWNDIVGGVFTDYRKRITCFGYDWLGRVFALDSARTRRGEQLVLLMEPGTADALEIPDNFLGFHENQMITNQDALVASDGFAEWRAGSGHDLPYDKCIGYERPLFLGGTDGSENFRETDLEVYWDLTGQIIDQVRNLPAGTPISSIRIE
jgi:hypothetical protein